MLKAGKMQEIADEIVGSQIKLFTPRNKMERIWFTKER